MKAKQTQPSYLNGMKRRYGRDRVARTLERFVDRYAEAFPWFFSYWHLKAIARALDVRDGDWQRLPGLVAAVPAREFPSLAAALEREFLGLLHIYIPASPNDIALEVPIYGGVFRGTRRWSFSRGFSDPKELKSEVKAAAREWTRHWTGGRRVSARQFEAVREELRGVLNGAWQPFYRDVIRAMLVDTLPEMAEVAGEYDAQGFTLGRREPVQAFGALEKGMRKLMPESVEIHKAPGGGFMAVRTSTLPDLDSLDARQELSAPPFYGRRLVDANALLGNELSKFNEAVHETSIFLDELDEKLHVLIRENEGQQQVDLGHMEDLNLHMIAWGDYQEGLYLNLSSITEDLQALEAKMQEYVDVARGVRHFRESDDLQRRVGILEDQIALIAGSLGAIRANQATMGTVQMKLGELKTALGVRQIALNDLRGILESIDAIQLRTIESPTGREGPSRQTDPAVR